MKLLITGAAGKVGSNLLAVLAGDPRFESAHVVALCNNRRIPETDRIRVLQGSVADPETVRAALDGVTHVMHMAAVKESPDLAIDVAVKGMFLLLEAFRQSPTAQQFLLISGDCTVGHIMQPYPGPITETSPRRAYAGCYALTKVLEEVMLEQYRHQYGLPGTCLRAPWIMEKDDFRHALSFGPDQFGGPPWLQVLPAETIARYAAGEHVPVLLDQGGAALRRSFIHVSDLVSAILVALGNPAAIGHLFNISMDAPVNYRAVGDHLQATRGMVPVDIPTPWHSNWLSNAKARLLLNWHPAINMHMLIDQAFAYHRDPDDPRKVWYPG